MTSSTATRQRIAIIGSGIAGLSCASILSKSHSVVLFEAMPTLGMDSHSIDVPSDLQHSAEMARLDVPLRIFVKHYYPELRALFDYHGVAYQTVDVASSYASAKGEALFHYRNLLLGNWFSVPVLSSLGALGRPAFLLNCVRVVYFIVNCGRAARHPGALAHLTFKQYLVQERFSAEFIDNIAIPMAALICTCSYDSVAAYPAAVLVDYFARSFMRWGGVQRATGGARDVVARLSVNCDVRLATPVASVRKRAADGALLVRAVGASADEVFDHVVLSTPAHIAAAILDQSASPYRAILATFKAEETVTVCHRDPRLMPADRSTWRSVNFITVREGAAPMATIWVNRAINGFENVTYDVFQTWNPLIEPAPDTVLSRSVLWRPVVTHDTLAALNALTKLQGADNVWICGSWTRWGVPLLEQAAISGIEVAEAIGPERRPWPATRRAQHSSAYVDLIRLSLHVLWVSLAMALWVAFSALLTPFLSSSWNVE
jgi:predicted NAD/FAD-binding protein